MFLFLSNLFISLFAFSSIFDHFSKLKLFDLNRLIKVEINFFNSLNSILDSDIPKYFFKLSLNLGLLKFFKKYLSIIFDSKLSSDI